MTLKEHDHLIATSPPYVALFQKYLGCLRAMADAAVYLRGREEAEAFDLAFDDAEATYPHLRVKRILDGRELEIVRPRSHAS